jgi:hypothetical protein
MTTCKNGTVIKDKPFYVFGEQLTSAGTGTFTNTHRFTPIDTLYREVYESFSEYEQAKDLDPKIFSEFTEKTGIEQKYLGNRTRLRLGSVKSGEAKLNRRLLDKISGDVTEQKRKEQEPEPNYGDPHYYVR